MESKQYELPKKCFGIYSNKVLVPNQTRWQLNHQSMPLILGTLQLRRCRKGSAINTVAKSDDAGAFIVISNDEKNIMVTGHFEYDLDTWLKNTARYLEKGIEIDVPENYFPSDDVTKEPTEDGAEPYALIVLNRGDY